MTRDTSLTAYRQTYLSGQAHHKRFKVFMYIADNTNCTRHEISIKTGIPINVVTPRVKELLDDGLIYENGKINNHYRLCAAERIAS